jgi:hypothetical protein
MSTHPGGISQVNTGQMGGGMQAAIGNNNQQSMHNQSAGDSVGLSQEDVIQLLVQIQALLEGSTLPGDIKAKATHRLNAALDEVQQEKPDKSLTAGNLKRMAELLETTNQTLDSGKGVWDKVQPILQQLSGWLNVATLFF